MKIRHVALINLWTHFFEINMVSLMIFFPDNPKTANLNLR